MILLFTSAIASAFAECRRELERLNKIRSYCKIYYVKKEASLYATDANLIM